MIEPRRLASMGFYLLYDKIYGGGIMGEYGVKYEDIKVYGMGLGYRV